MRPFVAEPVGTPKARGVVDDRAATQTAAGDQRDPGVGGRGEAALVVQLAHHRQLQLVEVGLVVVTAFLQDDHVLAGRRQLGRHHPTACARADDNGIAGQCRVAVKRCRLDDLGRRRRRRHGTRIADLRPHRVGAVVFGVPQKRQQ